MKITRVSAASGWNSDKDLTRMDFTRLRQIAKNIAKTNISMDKISSDSFSAETATELSKIASKLGNIDDSLKSIRDIIKSQK